jgi:hypothetical protein
MNKRKMKERPKQLKCHGWLITHCAIRRRVLHGNAQLQDYLQPTASDKILSKPSLFSNLTNSDPGSVIAQAISRRRPGSSPDQVM